ncbi:VOC family protein [Vibrio panuliri]|uniref:Lactoylglutathione lyase n=1 Tax=Vibrio panuliri TaxID=1381081 RepID=A0A1Q9HNA7_9VIBR|nr:VOC family protein [Vibrio panuliri]KAB1457777.1 VOC family protein [Vibrio panuliri]OLQ85740.1 lactoylglutathione lyase [Vibrio panuliri]OLQ92293.1 lactoylglutathione lyase [Vibrio panuliri]
MLKIVGLDHVVLRTTQLDKMLEFYQHKLGCPIERTLPELGLTQLRAGSALIDIVTVDSELGRLGGKAPQQNGRNMDHLCLQIEPISETDLITLFAQHQLRPEDFVERYGAQGFGRSVYLTDPEGNIVELKPTKENL